MSDYLYLLNRSPILCGLTLFILGSCVGSCINVIALRLPRRLHYAWRAECHAFLAIDLPPSPARPTPPTLWRPSHCPTCTRRLRFFDMIPLYSHLRLAGRCRFCRAPISRRYFIVELLSASLFVQVGLPIATRGVAAPVLLMFIFIFMAALITLSLIDLDYQMLPDLLVLPLLWLGLLVNHFGGLVSLESALLGAVGGYLCLWSLYQLHYRLTGRAGLGYGDFKLLAAIGGWLGWERLPFVLLVASLGGCLAIALHHGRTADLTRARPIFLPFAPYLAVASWVVLCWGEALETLAAALAAALATHLATPAH